MDSIKLSINACGDTSIEQLLSLARCSLLSLDQTPSGTLIDPPPQNIFAPAPLSRSIKTLVSTLSSSPDVSFLQSILFSPALPTNSRPSVYPLSVPILVNKPDERGWSAIHHACSFTVFGSPSKSSPSEKIPEIEILDMLYLAGADVSLFTVEEHYTPLHILAKTSVSVPSTISPVVKEQIRDFITHLVRDLGAPLGARDRNDETCLHMAAEYGASKDVMDILLDLDRVMNDGRVSKMKNTRGFLAADLAVREELKDSFVMMKEKMDMATIRRGSVSSALSDNTIRGSGEHTSLTAVTLNEFGVPEPSSTFAEGVSDPLDIDPAEKTCALLAHMRANTPTQYTLDQMDVLAAVLVKYFQARIEAAKKEVDAAKRKRDTAKANARALSVSLCSHIRTRSGGGRSGEGARTVKGKKWKNRESEDSQMTRVSSGSEDDTASRDVAYVNVSTQTAVGIGRNEFGTVKGPGWTEWLEGLINVEDATVKRKKDKKDKVKLDSLFAGGSVGEFGSVEKQKGEKEKEKGEKGTISSAHRLKNWWKKMVAYDHQSHTTKASGRSKSNEKLASASMVQLSYEIQDPASCPVGREARITRASASFSSLALADDDNDAQLLPQTIAVQKQCAAYLAECAEREGEWTIGKALRTAPIVFDAARKDLERIDMCLRNAEEYLKGAEASVERVGRVLKRALKVCLSFIYFYSYLSLLIPFVS